MTLALVVALPLAGAVLIALIGGRLGARTIGAIATLFLTGSFGAAVAIAQAFAAGKTSLVAEIGPWLPVRGADLALVMDPAMVPLVLMVTGVSRSSVCTRSAISRDAARSAIRRHRSVRVRDAAHRRRVQSPPPVRGVGARRALLVSAHRALERLNPAAANAGVKAFVVNRVGTRRSWSASSCSSDW
jgi:hypothetical protein